MILDRNLIGFRIMFKRKERGFSQEELAERIGLSKNHISNIERGKNIPTTTFILKICEVLGETPDYYLIGTSTKNTDRVTNLIKTLPIDKQELLLKLVEVYISETSNKNI